MPKHSGIADLIVKGAIALVTAAFFVGAYLQFQVSFWMALIGALAVYITLLMGHAVMRRRERETDLVSEVTRLEDEVARLKTGALPPAAARQPRVPSMPPPLAKAPTPPPMNDQSSFEVTATSTLPSGGTITVSRARPSPALRSSSMQLASKKPISGNVVLEVPLHEGPVTSRVIALPGAARKR